MILVRPRLASTKCSLAAHLSAPSAITSWSFDASGITSGTILIPISVSSWNSVKTAQEPPMSLMVVMAKLPISQVGPSHATTLEACWSIRAMRRICVFFSGKLFWSIHIVTIQTTHVFELQSGIAQSRLQPCSDVEYLSIDRDFCVVANGASYV
jgi:hypothetical protein